MKAKYIAIRAYRLLLIFQIRSKKHSYILYRNLFSLIQINKENKKKSGKFSAYYNNNLNGGLLKISTTESCNFRRFLKTFQQLIVILSTAKVSPLKEKESIFVASEQGLDTSVYKRAFKPPRLKSQICFLSLSVGVRFATQIII